MHQQRQTGQQQPSGIPGKKKNCNTWGEYEVPGASATAAMCNGGWYDRDFYHECPVKAECRAETQRKAGRVHLPLTHEPRPMALPRSVPLAGTPNLEARPALAAPRPKTWADQWGTRPSMPATSVPQKPVQAAALVPKGLPTPADVPAPLPYPVAPPKEWPAAMHTPYAGPSGAPSMGVTPTFLPTEDEGIFSRLAKNAAQGAIGAVGWHVFDFARTVDLFGRRH